MKKRIVRRKPSTWAKVERFGRKAWKVLQIALMVIGAYTVMWFILARLP